LRSVVSEAELLEGVRARSQPALVLLYERYHRRVLGQARRQLGADHADAIDDVVSETFTRFLAAVQERGIEVASIGGLLCSIARNLAVDRHREQRRVVLVRDFDDAQVVPPHDERDVDGAIVDGRWNAPRSSRDADALFEREAARMAFGRLPPPARAVIELVLDSDESAGRLAARLGKSQQSLSSAVYRTVERLRQEYVVAHVLPSESPSCWGCISSLGAFVRGELRARRQAAVIGHLRGCTDCRARLGAALEADGELPHPRRLAGRGGGRSDGK
jgi:RNA polymerase sigma factor (sigma-70 family)